MVALCCVASPERGALSGGVASHYLIISTRRINTGL